MRHGEWVESVCKITLCIRVLSGLLTCCLKLTKLPRMTMSLSCVVILSRPVILLREILGTLSVSMFSLTHEHMFMCGLLEEGRFCLVQIEWETCQMFFNWSCNCFVPKLLESQLSSFSELKLLFEMLDCSNSLEFFFNPLVVYLFQCKWVWYK